MGYCSEEATVLGILKTAEMIAVHDPDAYVVIQGILPVSRHDGRLESNPSRWSHTKKAHSVYQAEQRYLFWPSIEAINKELEEFCENHSQIIYFDASDLFIGSSGNKYYKGQHKQIISDLMPDYYHPSYRGYQVLLSAIHRELFRLILDEDQENDIEVKSDDP